MGIGYFCITFSGSDGYIKVYYQRRPSALTEEYACIEDVEADCIRLDRAVNGFPSDAVAVYDIYNAHPPYAPVQDDIVARRIGTQLLLSGRYDVEAIRPGMVVSKAYYSVFPQVPSEGRDLMVSKTVFNKSIDPSLLGLLQREIDTYTKRIRKSTIQSVVLHETRSLPQRRF